jgi:hypothetical protein
MNAVKWISMLAIVVFTAGKVVAAEDYYLVKLMGSDRKVETLSMPSAEFKTFEKNIKLEQKYFAKAVSQVGKEWRADELNKGIPFPGAKLAPRFIVGSQKFSSQEKADEQLSKIEDQESKRLEREAKKKQNPRRKSKDSESKEKELARAADLVSARVEELIAAKTEGGTDKEAANLDAGGAKVGVGINKKKN